MVKMLVNVTEEQKKEMHDRAKDMGISMSKLFRIIIDGYVKENTERIVFNAGGYTAPMYVTKEALQAMKGSPAFTEG